MKRLKVLELFGGIGSPRKALENIGFDVKTIDYVEVWDHAVMAYNALFDNNYKPESVVGWNLNVDLLVHGSPCQDFSTAGKNDLSTGRSILYQETLNIIESRLNPRPKFVVWENVKGLLQTKNFKHFEHYLDSMKSFGYKNFYKVLNSKDFGVPQSRNRVFCISVRDDINFEFDFEKLETKNYVPLKNFLNDDVDKSYFLTQISMAQAIINGKCKILTPNDISDTITTKQIRWNNAGVLAVEIKNFSNFMTIPRQSDGELVNGSYNRVWKIDKYVGTIAASKQEKIAIPIIDKAIEGVDVFIIEGKPYHLRVLTERECWRLMGWQDKDIDKVNFISKTKMYHMAGNAIVIQVLEAIFKELLKGLDK